MSKLLPLEYCKLDRAAELLGCKVQDILHWAAIRAINICVKDIGDGGLHNYFEVDGVLENASSYMVKANNMVITLSNYSSLQFFESLDSDTDESGLFPFGSAIGNRVEFDGFWILLRVDQLENKEVIEPPITLKPYASKFNIQGLLRICDYDEDGPVPGSFRSISIHDLWILRPDLEKLHHSITTGEPLLNIYNDAELATEAKAQEQQTSNNKYHHRSESTAINREQVLAAAVNVRENYPDECQGFSKWAQAVYNHSHIYWPNLEEPPLSIEKTERIIASAINHGKPDKKN